MVDKAKTKKIIKQFTPQRANIASIGGTPLELPNLNKGKAPESNRDLANKKYVDDADTAQTLQTITNAGATTTNDITITGDIEATTANFAGMDISNDGTKTTFLGKSGDYSRIGDAATTGNSLNSEDDLMVTGELEVKGDTFANSYQSNDVNNILTIIPSGNPGYTRIGEALKTEIAADKWNLFVSGSLEVNSKFYVNKGQFHFNSVADNAFELIIFKENRAEKAVINPNWLHDQFVFGVSDSVGKQIILCENDQYTKNYDHSVQDNPTLYIQSATNPDSDNTQWISMTHDQTNGVIDVGKGVVRVEGAIASGILDVDSDNDGTIAVGGINNIFIDASTAAVVINDFTGGVAGQVIHLVVKTPDASNTITITNTSGSNQELYNHSEANYVFATDERGGFTFICDGSNWYDVSHAKHV